MYVKVSGMSQKMKKQVQLALPSGYLQIVVDESARLRGAWREKVDVRCIPLIDWLGSQVSTRVLKVEGT